MPPGHDISSLIPQWYSATIWLGSVLPHVAMFPIERLLPHLFCSLLSPGEGQSASKIDPLNRGIGVQF